MLRSVSLECGCKGCWVKLRAGIWNTPLSATMTLARVLTWDVERFAVQRHSEPMPHYFFDLHNDDVAVDEEGRECADLTAARAVATQEIRCIAADDVSQGMLVTSHRIDIFDGARKLLASVSFGDAVAIT